jgi:CDP-paratose 2-epimerase
VVFRQSCVYGEHQLGVEDQGWVAHFVKQFLFKKSITIFGDGNQIRDLLYVNDLIKAYDLAIKKIEKVAGEAINIGGGGKNAFSLLEVIKILEKEFNYKIPVYFEKPRAGDQKYFVSKNEKIKKYLGWQPKTNFYQGLKRLISWQKKNFK